MNKRDFFRRLGLAVAALFVPKGVAGDRAAYWHSRSGTYTIVPPDYSVVFKDCTFEPNTRVRLGPPEDVTIVFKDCRIEGTSTFELLPRNYATGSLVVLPDVTIIGA